MTVLNNPQPHFSSQESLDSDVTPTVLFQGNSFDTTSESDADLGHHRHLNLKQYHSHSNHTQTNTKSSNVNHTSKNPFVSSSLSSSSILNPPPPPPPPAQRQQSESQMEEEEQPTSSSRHQSPLSNCSAAEAANVLFPPPTPRSKSNSPTAMTLLDSKHIPISHSHSHHHNNHHHHHSHHHQQHSYYHHPNGTNHSSSSNNSTNMMNISNDTDTVVTEVMATTDEDSFDISPLPSSPVNTKSTTVSMGLAAATAAGGVSSSSSRKSMAPPVLPSNMSSSSGGSSGFNSRKRTSSDRKKSKVRSHPYSMGTGVSVGGSGNGVVGGGSGSNSIPSSPLAFLSTAISRDDGPAATDNTNSSTNHHLPPPLTRTMFSQLPPPSSSSSSSSQPQPSLQPPSTAIKAKYQSSAFRAIQSSHSFDSCDTSTSYNSHNDLLHLDSANNQYPQSMEGSNSNSNSNTNTGNGGNATGAGGWMISSNYTFSGSPIEEEEPHHYEDDATTAAYHNDHRYHYRNSRHHFNHRHLHSPQSSSPLTTSTSIHHVHNQQQYENGNQYYDVCEDQFSSKIRRLNLDSEMGSNRSRTSSNSSCSIGGNGTTTTTTTKDEDDDTNTTINDKRWNRLMTSNKKTMGMSDSFRLHVTTDFNSPDPQQIGGGSNNDGRGHNRKHKNDNDDNDISPTDVMGFPFPSPSMSLSSSSTPIMPTSTMKSRNRHNHHQTANSSDDKDPLSFLPIKRNNIDDHGSFYNDLNRNSNNNININTNQQILNLNKNNDDDDDGDDFGNSNHSVNSILPPPNTFSSPPPHIKKGLHGPPSPCRIGRIGGKVLHPPTTPMVPQKAMRRMRGHDGINNGSTPSSNITLPLSGGSVGGDRGRMMMNMNGNATNLEEVSRFDTDFKILGTLGKGSFGTVYKCRSRLDNRLYAVKAAKRRAKGRADRDRMLKEVYALAELSDLADTTAFHIVRYHQAWMEEDKLHIVTELCTSTLQIEMQSGIFHGNTKRLYKLLREMLLALRLIHFHGLVHLDIKPENIFVREDTFKLGDFGLVSKVSVEDDVEEGDSRYMCMDLLSGNHKDLRKCDIFSLGITMYEIVLERPLPLDGQEWQDLRAGKLNATPHAQSDLQNIIKAMMHPDANQRPHASELLTRRQLLSEEQKQLIIEQNRVREANLALAYQEARFKKIASPKRGLTRSNTCPR